MTSSSKSLLSLTILGILSTHAFADALWLENPKLKVQVKVQPKVWAFDLKDVRLLDGPFKHAMDLNGAYVLSLDVDRLLHTFRLNAGLPSSAQPLGGWEEPNCELRGHFVGHYMSACALMYASTGDERYRQKGDAIVAGLAQCQVKIGTGYLSAYPESFFDRVEALQQVWAPYYTLHKIFAGLEDMVEYCGNSQALEVCKKFGDWVISRNSRLTDQQMQAMLGAEHGGMNETLANLYALTGEEKYLTIALRFNHKTVIDPASQKQDRLTGLHANTQFPKFIGAVREYELTGDPSLYSAATFFWNAVVNERSYVIGGNSDGEMFTPKERLSEALGPNTTETCNTYNMLKLTRHLLCLLPEVKYGDYYERALFNHILASQNPEDGMTCYYVPLRSGMTRGGAGNGFCTPLNSFWCCTGTGIENHAKYGDSIYFHNDNILYVNLFIASELDWRAKGVRLRQETRYPDEDSTKLTFTCDQPVELSLRIRSPRWAKSVRVTLNGQPSTVDWVAQPRTWKTGDVVEVKMPFTLRVEAFKDNPNRFAFMNGPIVLCAQVDPTKAMPAIVADPNQMMASIHAVADKANTFTMPADIVRIPGENAGVAPTLEPFYKVHGNRPYAVYWDRFSPQQWQSKETEYKADLPRVQIVTDLGTIEVELDAKRAPVTVANFLKYVDGGFFTDGRFFRTVTMANQPNDKVKIQVIQAEANPARQAELFAPIPMERTKDTGIRHLDGTLSMARDKPDTAQDSFSICIGDQPDLDFGGKRNPDGQGFAAFGHVVSGMDVARKIQACPSDGQRLTPRVRIQKATRVR